MSGTSEKSQDLIDLTTRPPTVSPVEAETIVHQADTSERAGKWNRRIRLLSQFFAGQTMVQGLNFLVGFLLLRWLDETAYAQYSVAFAFQSTVGALVDLGFTASIIALVGEEADKPDVVGRQLRTARHYRTRSFIVIIIAATIIYPFAIEHQPWGWKIKTLLYLGIFISLAADNLLMYASVLFIHRRLDKYYRAQITAGAWRLVTCAIFYVGRILNSWTASLVTAIASLIYGLMYRQSAVPLIEMPEHADPATNRRMLRYIAPLVPGMIFAAFQGQISVALITFFGKTQSIAEVGALGRLAVLFTLLSTFNQVIIEPFIARTSRQTLLRKYLQVVISQIVVGVVVTVGAILLPGPLLWIMGPHYYHLRPEIGWVALTASVNYLCGGLWTMNSARKWIYWWGTGFYFVMILGTQIVAACTLDLSRTHDVIKFGFWTSAGLLAVHAVNGIYGFIFGVAKRNLPDENRLAAEV